MKKAALTLTAIAVVCAFLGSSADAQHCSTPRRAVIVNQHHAHHSYAHHAHHAADVLIARFVDFPVYSTHSYATYADPAAQLKSELTAAKQEIEILKLQQRIQALESGLAVPQAQKLPSSVPQKQVMPPAVQGDKHPGQTAISQSCVECHNTAMKKGGLILDSNAALLALTDKQKLSIVRDLMTQRMPPKTKLSNEAASDIIELVTNQIDSHK